MTNQRNRIFWAIALQVTIANFYLGGFGPAQPLLRAQQHTSLTVAGLHGTALGIAAILAGFATPRLVHRFGRPTSSWLGLSLLSAGVLMFVFFPPVQLTLFATLVVGLGSALVVNSMVTQLSHHFPVNSSGPISQASGVASAGYVLGTLIVGAIAGTTFSWRIGLLLVIPASVVLYVATKDAIATEHTPDKNGPQRGSLNGKFWIAWIGFVACISSEFATTFWAAALVRNRVGSSASVSTICIVALGVGMGLGRWFGPQILRRYSLDFQIKAVMLVQFLGFGILWFSHTMWISLLALLTVGLGLSMQFALASLRLIGFSQGRPDLAIAKSSLGTGVAIALAPFLLGVLGDHLGISRAYLMVPVLIIVAFSTIATIPSTYTTQEELNSVI